MIPTKMGADRIGLLRKSKECRWKGLVEGGVKIQWRQRNQRRGENEQTIVRMRERQVTGHKKDKLKQKRIQHQVVERCKFSCPGLKRHKINHCEQFSV